MAGGGNCHPIQPLLKLWVVRDFLPVRIFCQKNAKCGLKTSILQKFIGKSKILNTHNLLCRKFAAVCWKSATSCYFLKPRPRWLEQVPTWRRFMQHILCKSHATSETVSTCKLQLQSTKVYADQMSLKRSASENKCCSIIHTTVSVRKM